MKDHNAFLQSLKAQAMSEKKFDRQDFLFDFVMNDLHPDQEQQFL